MKFHLIVINCSNLNVYKVEMKDWLRLSSSLTKSATCKYFFIIEFPCKWLLWQIILKSIGNIWVKVVLKFVSTFGENNCAGWDFLTMVTCRPAMIVQTKLFKDRSWLRWWRPRLVVSIGHAALTGSTISNNS